MKHILTAALLLLTLALSAQQYSVVVNDTLFYNASPTGQADFQGRDQFAAFCVPLRSGDVLKCYNRTTSVLWVINAIDEGDTWGAPGFSATANGLTCSIAGNYNIYIKLKFEDDVWYVETASDCTPATPVDPDDPGQTDPDYSSSAPANCPDVMLQGFYWDSYTDKGYGRTKWIDLKTQTSELGEWFDMVWLPPCSKSTGGTGYLPVTYASLDSDWGTKGNLYAVIDTLHHKGCRVVADIVINHAASNTGWCSMASENFGEYGSFSPTMSWICSTDEAFTGGHCSQTPGNPDDGYGSEANYEAGRDWDHNNAEVREMFKAYLKWMRYVVGFDGFRYDYCKGFHNSHINEYNTAAQAYFSVMEYWDGNVETLKARLGDAGWNTLTFDFGTKYEVFNNGIASDNYNICGKGLPGAGKSRYACTFIDSHDSFQRDNNEFCGLNNSMRYQDKLLQANAYLLSMPGIPCVFYPHWVTFKTDIKAMINARYKTGVHSESAVSDESGNGYYKATITGTNGQIRLLLGPNSGYATTPSGFTLAAKGTNWGVYYKTNSARGDKNTERTPVRTDIRPTTAVEEVAVPEQTARKVMRNGVLYIEQDGALYTIMGQRVQ